LYRAFTGGLKNMGYREQLLEAIAFNNKISAIVVIVDKETDFHG
jgi:hypothetical protein